MDRSDLKRLSKEELIEMVLRLISIHEQIDRTHPPKTAESPVVAW